MKKIFVMLALTMGVVSANAQSVDSTAVTNTVAGDVTLTTDIYPQQEDGDIYHGLTKKLTFDRMIPPYGLEVTYDKTTHIIFPAAVRYVDLGSPNLIAGKADGSENVIRVKATVKNFRDETNMSVITESGSFTNRIRSRLSLPTIEVDNSRKIPLVTSSRSLYVRITLYRSLLMARNGVQVILVAMAGASITTLRTLPYLSRYLAL